MGSHMSRQMEFDADRYSECRMVAFSGGLPNDPRPSGCPGPRFPGGAWTSSRTNCGRNAKEVPRRHRRPDRRQLFWTSPLEVMDRAMRDAESKAADTFSRRTRPPRARLEAAKALAEPGNLEEQSAGKDGPLQRLRRTQPAPPRNRHFDEKLERLGILIDVPAHRRAPRTRRRDFAGTREGSWPGLWVSARPPGRPAPSSPTTTMRIPGGAQRELYLQARAARERVAWAAPPSSRPRPRSSALPAADAP